MFYLSHFEDHPLLAEVLKYEYCCRLLIFSACPKKKTCPSLVIIPALVMLQSELRCYVCIGCDHPNTNIKIHVILAWSYQSIISQSRQLICKNDLITFPRSLLSKKNGFLVGQQHGKLFFYYL